MPDGKTNINFLCDIITCWSTFVSRLMKVHLNYSKPDEPTAGRFDRLKLIDRLEFIKLPLENLKIVLGLGAPL